MAKPLKILFFVNPDSGSIHLDSIWAKIKEIFDKSLFDYEVLLPKPGQLIEDIIADALKNQFDIVVAIGGDGTISAVAHAVSQTHLLLGIVPTGTGNVLARELRIPTKVRSALELIASGRYIEKHIDGIKVNGNNYFICVSVGLSALIMKDVDSRMKRFLGWIAYLLRGAINYFRYKHQVITLEIDGEKFTSVTSDVLITNFGQKFIPGFNLSPDIHPDDGKLDVFAFKIDGFWKIIKILIRILMQRNNDIEELRHFTEAQKIHISCKNKMVVQGDGDVIGTTPVDIEIMPRVLKVIAPL